MKYEHRRAARLACIQGLFQVLEGNSLEEVLQETFLKGAQLDEETFIPLDDSFFEELLRGVLEKKERIDEIIKENLKEGWTFEKMDRILLAILRTSIYELLEEIKTDTAVIIKEYVLITESFFDDRKVAFIHRTLDHLAKKERNEGISIATESN